jgi:hypothetical protein
MDWFEETNRVPVDTDSNTHADGNNALDVELLYQSYITSMWL